MTARWWGVPAAAVALLLGLVVVGPAAVRSVAFHRQAAVWVSRWVEAQLGRPTSVERVEVWADRVTLHRVRVAGLVRAEQVHVEWDLPSLVRERLAGRSGLWALRRVRLVAPFVVFVRGPQGRWNVEDLWRPAAVGPPAPAERLQAELQVEGGTAQVVDGLGGLRFSAREVRGRAWLADLPLIRLSAEAAVLPGTPARVWVSGWVDTQGAVADLAVRFAGARVTDWARFLAQDPRWRWEGGTVSGRLRLYGEARAPQLEGEVQLDGVAVWLPRERLRVRATGPVGVSGRWVSLRSVKAQVGSAVVDVSGEVRLAGEGAVELDARFRGADLAMVRRLVGAGLPVRGRVEGRVEVEGPLSAVRIRARLQAPMVRVGPETIQDATAQVDYGVGTVVIRSAAARLRGGTLRADAVASATPPRLVATAWLDRVDAAAASSWGLHLPLGGTLTGAVVVAGGSRDPAVGGVLRGARGELLAEPVDGWSAAFDYAGGTLKLYAARARSGGAEVHAWGEASGRSVHLDVAGRGVPVEQVVRRAGVHLPASGRLDVSGRVTGSLRAPQFSGRLWVGRGSVGTVRWDEAVLRLEASGSLLRVADLRWRDGPDTYQAAGWVSLRGSELDVRLQTPGARVERLLELGSVNLPVTGEVRGWVHVAGSLHDPVASGWFRLWGVQTPVIALSTAAGQFRWEGGVLSLEEAAVHSPAFDVRLQGAVSSTGHLQLWFSADPTRLEEVPQLRSAALRLSGQLAARGQVTGTVDAPVVEAQLSADRVQVNGETFHHVQGDVRWARGTLEARALRLHRGGASYSVEGRLSLSDDPMVDLVLEAKDADLLSLLAMVGVNLDADGRLSGRLALSGPLSRPRAELDVRLADGRLRGYRFPSASARAVLEDGRVVLQDVEVVASQGRLRAQGTVDLRGQTEVEVAGLGLEASAVSTLARLRTPLVGTLDFTVQLSGDLRDPTAGLALEVRGFGVAGAQVDRLTAHAIYRDGFLELEQLLLEEDGQRVRARGRLPLRLRQLEADPQGPVDFVASTDRADLGFLRLLPFVQEAEGPVEASLRVQGTVADPRMEGFVRADGGRLKLRGLDPALERIQLDVSFDHTRAALRQFRADLGGGAVEATGEARFEGLRLQGYRLQVSPRGTRVRVQPYLQAAVDGTAEVAGTATRARLAGRLVLSSGELVAATPPRGPNGAAPFPVDLDLELLAGEGLFVIAGPVRLQMGGALHVGGTVGQPALSGTVRGRGGEYRAFGTTFTVEEGVAVFQEFRGTQPVVSARATTRVGDVTVFVDLSGTPDQMQVRLRSDPELPHDRIVQLLAAQAGIQQALGGQVEAALRQQLTRFLLGEFEQRLRQLLGLQELRVEYDFEKPLRLRMGRFLLQDLYLTLTSVFDAETRFLWALEYRFARHYALAFSHDTAGVWMVLLRANFAW
ncbi:MAG: translocation/assembly module TamB domain-containing protein [Armatimonadota bacterium]|nr:translocation/assembly module TamB domain-containing protein [Armatimonadota bacterium]MDW8156022.1 translocation/assembly module TamB domain-containing protein [Armatimonadota bacterium]